MTHAVCAECGKEYDYDLKPGFPRKYCPDCSALKKAQFEAKVPMQIGATPAEQGVRKAWNPQKPYFDKALIQKTTEEAPKEEKKDVVRAAALTKICFDQIDVSKWTLAEIAIEVLRQYKYFLNNL